MEIESWGETEKDVSHSYSRSSKPQNSSCSSSSSGIFHFSSSISSSCSTSKICNQESKHEKYTQRKKFWCVIHCIIQIMNLTAWISIYRNNVEKRVICIYYINSWPRPLWNVKSSRTVDAAFCFCVIHNKKTSPIQ